MAYARLHHISRQTIFQKFQKAFFKKGNMYVCVCGFRTKVDSYSFHPGQCIVKGSQRKMYSCHCTTPEARCPWEYLYRLGRIYSTYLKQKKTQLSKAKCSYVPTHFYYPAPKTFCPVPPKLFIMNLRPW